MKCAIVGGGAVENYDFFTSILNECDAVICADGGIRHLIHVNISPDVFIGDFDSCREEITSLPIMKGVEIQRFKPEKDDTDMQLCINYALEREWNDIVILAALGGRIDHELSNIYMLRYILDRGARGVIFDYSNRIYITDSHLKLKKEAGFKLSVIPLSPAADGVSLKGLLYPLHNAPLVQGTSVGVSNEFVSDYAEITVKNGVLLVVVSRDND